MACSDHVHVECAEKVNMRREDHSQVFLKFTHEQCHLETALPMEWRERSVSPRASGLGTCPFALAQTSLLTLGAKSRRSVILVAQLHCNRHYSRFRRSSLFGIYCPNSFSMTPRCPSSSSTQSYHWAMALRSVALLRLHRRQRHHQLVHRQEAALWSSGASTGNTLAKRRVAIGKVPQKHCSKADHFISPGIQRKAYLCQTATVGHPLLLTQPTCRRCQPRKLGTPRVLGYPPHMNM